MTGSASTMKKAYFVVWNPSSGYTRFKHESEQAAEREAQRLAREHKGQEFVVLATRSVSKSSDVTTERFEPEDQIPF